MVIFRSFPQLPSETGGFVAGTTENSNGTSINEKEKNFYPIVGFGRETEGEKR